MPPVYFHGNYNWYKEHNHAVRLCKFSATKHCFFHWVTTISCAFSPVINKSLHTILTKNWISVADPLSHCWNVPRTASLCSRPLFGFHKCSTSIHDCHCVQFFSAWRNSVSHLFFICTSTSDTILSDCPSAVICSTAIKYNGILVRRFNLYCHTTNICLWCHG